MVLYPAPALASLDLPMIATPDDVLTLWFGPGPQPTEAHRAAWWKKDPAFDRGLSERFGPTLERAAAGELGAWAATPRGRVALVLVLDQFSRQIWRDTPAAFAQDPLAVQLCLEALAREEDRALALHERLFLIMPLMHSESLAMQDLAITTFEGLAADGKAQGDAGYEGNLSYAHAHRDIILRFGRYPHRNAILGRPSTAEESHFLTQPGSSF